MQTDKSSERCRLCEEIAPQVGVDSLARSVFRCPNCDYVFVSRANILAKEDEESRYLEHKNFITDSGYVKFLSRLLDPLEHFLKHDDLILDYGSGPNPVLAEILRRKGFETFTYDPFFSPVLHEAVYDVVTATESFEHFLHPKDELKTIISFLNTRGILGVMTLRFESKTDFATWHYARDATHTGFYSDKTFRWIESKFDLERIYDDGERVIIWQKKT